jgi:hypothetical protein
MRRPVRFVLAIVIALVSTIAVAHTDGIYNPTANSVGDTQGIDSNGAAASASVGPPTFTYIGSAAFTAPTGNTIAFPTLGIGTAGATRFVAVIVVQANQNTPALSATINGSSSGVLVTNLGGNSQCTIDLISAQVPTGTTMNLVVTYASPPAGGNEVIVWTSDTTTMSSTTPVISSVVQAASNTIVTNTINLPTSGYAVLAAYDGFGITNNTQAFVAPNDPSVASDGTFGSIFWGHANGAAANASSRVSVSWTTTADGNLALVGFR